MASELILLFILGCAVGSFLTVVVERFDTAESFWTGRSHCNQCKTDLTWWELVPVVGYLILHGTCVHCKKVIPRIYPLFELITGLSFAGVFLAAQQPIHYGLLALELLFVCLLLLLAFYDWINQAFPVVFLYAALAGVMLIVLVRIWKGPIFNDAITITDPLFVWLSSPASLLHQSIKGGIVGAILLGLLAFPSGGRWMGYGDVALAAILGFWLGYPFILSGLLLAFHGRDLWDFLKWPINDMFFRER